MKNSNLRHDKKCLRGHIHSDTDKKWCNRYIDGPEGLEKCGQELRDDY